MHRLLTGYRPYVFRIIETSNGATIDFKDETSQRRLTEAILQRDFSVKMILPPGRLCPPVPNRLNYILWLEDVLDASSLAFRNSDTAIIIRGLDIGTGASAIYPLLGCRTHPDWVFTATEIDGLSIENAQRIVDINGLQDVISVVRADPAGPMFLPLLPKDATYDFTMCNPPFYSSRDEVIQSAEAKEYEPNAVCTGADVEMITPGGEAAFVNKMVQESLTLRDRCRWFTSMLGKMSSLTHIVQLLREHKIDNYAVTELVQGQTRRWVIAWSFGDVHLPDSIGRLAHPGLQNIMPARNTLRQPLPRATSVAQVAPVLASTLASIPGLSISERSDVAGDVVVSAARDTWSRAARRRKKDAMEGVENGTSAVTQLVCRIRCESMSEGQVSLSFDWVVGRDRALFESFASHVERKMLSM